jgi:hypothetical protein
MIVIYIKETPYFHLLTHNIDKINAYINHVQKLENHNIREIRYQSISQDF